MTDENQSNDELQPDKDDQWPEPAELNTLDDGDSGTLMDIEPTSPNLEPAPTLLEAESAPTQLEAEPPTSLEQSEPAATMFEPTTPGLVSAGSVEETMAGATGSSGRNPATNPADNAPPPPSQSSPHRPPASSSFPSAPVPASGAGLMSGGSGGMPIAPFGGKIVVGTRISQIEVTGVLGKGGMGEVFRGYHHALDIDVAIKVLPDEMSRNDLVRQRFLREARLCVKLDHPHIVRVYNVDEYAGNMFLVMEMIDGTDAAHMLKDGGRFAYTRALEIGEASAKALTCAHGQGLVHRDIKPHNILLGRDDGKIKISDFGLARAATSSSHLTMSGQIMGTPHYMSPEQAESKDVTDKSDVYSLGITIYHMLTGETPFTGDTPISVAVQHIAKEVLYPEGRFKGFPVELVAVLKRMTAKDPTKRCSAKQAAVWLRKLIDMAPDQDVAQQGELMQTMAPVVRESMAFEAAKKDREAQDERAREMARTMQATMQEMEARQPSAQVPALATGTASTAGSHTAVDLHAPKSGKGGLIAAGLILLLGGGGFAAWKMGLIPGAVQSNGNTDYISVGPNANGQPPKTNTGNRPDSTSNNQPDSNTPANNGSTTTPPDDGGTDPDPEDENVNLALKNVATVISTAASIDDINKAKNQLDSISMGLGTMSERQRNEYNKIRSNYDRLAALLSARALNDEVRTELAKSSDVWAQDLNAGIRALNKAIDAKKKLDSKELPVEAEQALATEREAETTALLAALKNARELIYDEAIRLASLGSFTEADSKMVGYEKIHLSEDELSEVSGLRTEFQVRALIKLADAHIAVKDYPKAGGVITNAMIKATNDGLRDEVSLVAVRLKDAVGKAFARHIKAADKAVADSDFESALNELDRAGDLPLGADQLLKLADRTWVVNVSTHIGKVESSLEVDAYKEASESLIAADTEIKNGQNKTLPTEISTRLENARSLFVAKLQTRFVGLLESAKANLSDSKFAIAAAKVAEADKLPLSKTQRDTLDDFRNQNKKTLETYVAILIAAIEKALDENDFESARLKLEEEKSLPVPDDLKPKLEELRARFASKAIKRHSDLLTTAKIALEGKRYTDARKALDELVSIPVDETRKAEASATDKKYWETLTADAESYLKTFDEKVAANEFEAALTELEAVEALPLNDELSRKVKLKRTTWEEKLEIAFADKLQRAFDARKKNTFKTSSKILKEAAKLPLTQAQLLRLSDAQDVHKKGMNSYIDKLFKQLRSYIAAGKEREGKLIANKLENLVESLTHKMRLRDLRSELTGETREERLKRLPNHLTKQYGDKICRAEQTMYIGEEISAVYVTPDGKYAAVGTSTGKVVFYNLKRGTKLGTSRGGRRGITAIGMSADGSMALCGNDDGDLVSFTISGSTIQTKALGSLDDDITAIVFGKGINCLWVLTEDGDISRYNPKTHAKISTTPSRISTASALAISPDNKLLAVGGTDAEIKVFGVSNMLLKKTLQGPGDDLIQRISFSANSKKMVAGSEGDGIGVWNTDRLSKDPAKQYKDLPRWVLGVGFNSDASRVVALDDENQIRVFDSKTGKKTKTVKFEDIQSEDRDIVVTAGFVASDGTIFFGTEEGELYHFSLRK